MTIRDFFEDEDYIFAPAHNGDSPTWHSTDECLWDAPGYMLRKVPLFSTLGDSVSPVLTEFFHTTLGICNANANDLIRELSTRKQRRKNGTNIDPQHVRDLYRRLNALRLELKTEQLEIIRYGPILPCYCTLLKYLSSLGMHSKRCP
jgi:hypothetical protein